MFATTKFMGSYILVNVHCIRNASAEYCRGFGGKRSGSYDFDSHACMSVGIVVCVLLNSNRDVTGFAAMWVPSCGNSCGRRSDVLPGTHPITPFRSVLHPVSVALSWPFYADGHGGKPPGPRCSYPNPTPFFTRHRLCR